MAEARPFIDVDAQHRRYVEHLDSSVVAVCAVAGPNPAHVPTTAPHTVPGTGSHG